MELLLKGVEDQAAEHTADEEYSHCGAGKGSGAHAALGDDEGDVRTHDAVGIDEHENDRAEQPGNGSNLEVALLAVCLSRLVCGEIDAAENQRDKRVKESEVGVIPSLCSKNAADEGQVHAAAVCEKILNTHELAALFFGIVLSDDAVGGGHKETETEAEDGLPHHKLDKAGVQSEAEDSIGNDEADAYLAEDLLGYLSRKQRGQCAAEKHCKAGPVGHFLHPHSGNVGECGGDIRQCGLKPHAAHFKRGHEQDRQRHQFFV